MYTVFLCSKLEKLGYTLLPCVFPLFGPVTGASIPLPLSYTLLRVKRDSTVVEECL